MPRPSKGIRLWLRRERKDSKGRVRPATWIILDGSKHISTGCGSEDREGAHKALTDYLASIYCPEAGQRDPARLEVNDVLAVYGREQAPHAAAPERIGYALNPLLQFWAGQYIDDVRGATCREYVAWRTSQTWATATKAKRKITIGTARRELECLQSAINYYAKEYRLQSVPLVTLPEKPASRDRWLTRKEAAAMLLAAWRNPSHRHIVRFLLIGLYTGTRHSAILKLKWMPSTDGGWIDLEAGLLYRRGSEERRTKKRQPTSRIPPRLLFWLRRWKAEDDAANALRAMQDHSKPPSERRPPCVNVVSWRGKPIAKQRRAWAEVRQAAGLDEDVTPHVMRHTAATWLMQGGAEIWDAAGYLGMDATTLERVYGHHHPDYQRDVTSRFGSSGERRQ